MSYYELLLFGHIVAIATWLGSDITVQFFAKRARAAGPDRLGSLLEDIEAMGTRILMPASLFVVVFGVLMVLDSPAWEFSQLWITLGLAMFLASAITGAAFLGPESGRIGQLIDSRGIADPEVQSRIRRILLISRIELILLVLIVLDMVVKPGL